MSRTTPIDFPSLTAEEFTIACRRLVDAVNAEAKAGREEEEWRVSEAFGQTYVVVKRSVPAGQTVGTSTAAEEKWEWEMDAGDEDFRDFREDEDMDDEVLPRPPRTATSNPFSTTVEYNIVLSPIHNLPILYFQLHPSASSPHGHNHHPSLKEIYRLLVPRSLAPQIQGVGIIGGISQGEHAIFGGVWWFVHPCYTSEALREWCGEGGKGIAVEKYLSVWIGLVGGVVGLWVPGVKAVGCV
ncbi:hypothetical protein RUND412_003855 [Rhizina undulata]